MMLEEQRRDRPSERPLGPFPGDFVTIKEAAAKLGVSYGTIRNAILAGKLAAFKILGTYRIQPADLDAFARDQLVPAPERAHPVNLGLGPASISRDCPPPVARQLDELGGAAHQGRMRSITGDRVSDHVKRPGPRQASASPRNRCGRSPDRPEAA